jgi:hypothetical protein
MVKFAWSAVLSCADVLLDLEGAGVEVMESKFFQWDGLSVVAYVEGEDRFPDDFDEKAERAQFFKDINKEFKIS